MRWRIPLIICLALVGGASCADQPAAPQHQEASATPEVAQGAGPLFQANQGWEYGTFNVDGVSYVECLGENVRFYGLVPYKWHRVFNSSGGYSDFFALVPATPNTPFFAEGVSSGIGWEAKGSPNPQMSQAGPGEVAHLSITETYISNDGPTLRSKGGFHVNVNANGDVTALRPFTAEFFCTGQG